MVDSVPQPHPILAEYNPFDPAQARDPYPMYAHARDHTPIFYSPILKMWVVTRYDDIMEIVHDTARFSSRPSVNPMGQMPPEVLTVLAQGYPQVPHLVNNDPPAHTRVRRLCNKAFTSQRIAGVEPRIREWANVLIDGFVAAGKADLQLEFAFPLPRIVISDIVGVPRADIDKFGQWAQEWTTMLFTPRLPVEGQLKGAHSAVALQKYCEGMIERRRNQSEDDLLSDLVQAGTDDGTAFTNVELIGLLSGFLIAGHLTTSDLIGNALVLLMRQPEQWQALCREPQRASQIVEEVLRRDTSVPGMIRSTTEAVTVKGVTIPKGSRVFLAFSAANHDEAIFQNPTAFDPGRDNLQKHLAFGQGIHYCIGAPLARLEGRISLELLSKRLPNLRLQPEQTVTYTPNPLFHGPDHLHMMWDVV